MCVKVLKNLVELWTANNQINKKTVVVALKLSSDEMKR
jgi:hypothetical protein